VTTTSGRDVFSGDQLSSLYADRFNTAELESKRLLWETLCRGFFDRYIDPKSTVLDLAAGSCEFINAIHAERKIAVDLNPDTKLFARDAEVVLAPSDDMKQIETASVDVVFTSNFFEHLPDKPALVRTLDECHRVLRPGGRLMVLMPNIRYVGARYWDYFDHHLPLSHNSLVEGLRMTGYEPEQVIARFLPYTVKDSPLKVRPLMVKAYLRLKPAWRILGRQMFVVAKTVPKR
jgi:SAM-dependent methyltransferase